MSFLGDDKIAISSYPDLTFLTEDQQYLRMLRKVARENGLEVVDIKDRPVDEKCWLGNEFIYSARGCFVNFLKLNDTIILPDFDLPKYPKQNCFTQNKNKLEKMKFNVENVDCTMLSSTGGVVHCVSWEY